MSPVGPGPDRPVGLDELLEFIASHSAPAPRVGTPAPEAIDTPASALADFVPFASVTGQSIWDQRPMDDEEEKRRVHVSELVLTLADSREPEQERTVALAHLIACDPIRGVGLMAQLLANTIDSLDLSGEVTPGTTMRVIRATSEEEARIALDEGHAGWAAEGHAGFMPAEGDDGS